MQTFGRAFNKTRTDNHLRKIVPLPSGLNQQALLALFLLSGCSLKNFNYLTEGGNGSGGATSLSSSGGAGDGGASAAPGGTGGAPSSDTGGTLAMDASGGTMPVGAGGSSAELYDGGMAGACAAPFTACVGDPRCTDLTRGTVSGATVNHCGTCDITCSVTNATSAACTASKCVPVCKTGFADCNATAANDGCESELAAPATCGQCGHKCSSQGVLTTKCNAGACTPTCLPSYANCDADPSTGTDLANNGCEVYLDALKGCGVACGSTVVCAANEVCNAGVCGAAQGLVAFSVPLTTSSQKQRFADKFATPPNLTDATVTLRVYAPGATGGTLIVYMSDAPDYTPSPLHMYPLIPISAGWTDVVVPVDPALGDYNPSSVAQVTFEIRSDDAGPWANPTLLYVDAIWSSNGAINDTFDSTFGGIIPSSYEKVEGSTYTWTAALP